MALTQEVLEERVVRNAVDAQAAGRVFLASTGVVGPDDEEEEFDEEGGEDGDEEDEDWKPFGLQIARLLVDSCKEFGQIV